MFVTRDNNKITNLKYLLETEMTDDAKIIIFSEFDGTFDAISKLLHDIQLDFKLLKGSGNSINHTLDWFNEDNAKRVLLLNARYCGAGINIPRCSDVVIYHKMDDALKQQVIGRAQRPGRNGPLKVHHLLYENE